MPVANIMYSIALAIACASVVTSLPAGPDTVVPETKPEVPERQLIQASVHDVPAPDHVETSVVDPLNMPPVPEYLECTEHRMHEGAFTGATFECTEDNVNYHITVPSHCTTDKPCGVIVDVPGWLTSRVWQEQATGITARALEGKKFMVIQPEDRDLSWAHQGADKGDHKKIEAFLRKSLKVYADILDKNHVHVMGFSQGGKMTWFLSCTASDIVCSTAPHAMTPGFAQKIPFITGFEIPDSDMSCYTDGKGPATLRSSMWLVGNQDSFFSHDHIEHGINTLKSVYGVTGDGTAVDDVGSGVDWKRYPSRSGVMLEVAVHDFKGNADIKNPYPSPPFPAVVSIGGHCYPKKGQGLHKYMGLACGPADNGEVAGFTYGDKAIEFFEAHGCDEAK